MSTGDSKTTVFEAGLVEGGILEVHKGNSPKTGVYLNLIAHRIPGAKFNNVEETKK